MPPYGMGMPPYSMYSMTTSTSRTFGKFPLSPIVLNAYPSVPPPGPLPPGAQLPPGYVRGPGGVAVQTVTAAAPRSYAADYEMNKKLIMVGLQGQIMRVWVGKISPVLEDTMVKKLLEVCIGCHRITRLSCLVLTRCSCVGHWHPGNELI